MSAARCWSLAGIALLTAPILTCVFREDAPPPAGPAEKRPGSSVPSARPAPWGPVVFLGSPGASAYAPPGEASPIDRAVAGEALRSARQVVVHDPCLSAAAAELASHVRPDCHIWPHALEQAALHHAGCTDGSAVSLLVCSPEDSDAPLLDAVRKMMPGLSGEGLTDCGAARVPGSEGWVSVALFTARGVRLDPFPRRLDPGQTAILSGRGAEGLRDLRLFRLSPGGSLETLPVTAAEGGRFTSPVAAPAASGLHWLELMGDGRLGPTVLALFPVAVGEAPPREVILTPPPDESLVRTEADAEALLLLLLNQDRAAAGLPSLSPDERLAEVARAHARDMRDGGFFGHVSPATGSPPDRLRRARIAVSALGENLGKATSIAGAEEAILSSPAHRATLLNPLFGHVGIGVAPAEEGGVRVWYAVQLFARLQEEWTPELFADGVAAGLARWRREAAIEAPRRVEEIDLVARRLVPIAERGASGQAALDEILRQAETALRRSGFRFRSLFAQSQVLTDPADLQVPPEFAEPGRDLYGVAAEEREDEGVSRRWVVLLLIVER